MEGRLGIVHCPFFDSQPVYVLNSLLKIKMTDVINNRIFFFKFENLILTIFTYIYVSLHGPGDYEKIR